MWTVLWMRWIWSCYWFSEAPLFLLVSTSSKPVIFINCKTTLFFFYRILTSFNFKTKSSLYSMVFVMSPSLQLPLFHVFKNDKFYARGLKREYRPESTSYETFKNPRLAYTKHIPLKNILFVSTECWRAGEGWDWGSCSGQLPPPAVRWGPNNISLENGRCTPRRHKLRHLSPVCITVLWVLGSYTDRQLLQTEQLPIQTGERRLNVL